MSDITEDPASPWYVGPRPGRAPSGDELRAAIVAQVDHDIADDDNWLSRLIRGILRDSAIQRGYADRVAAARVADGLELRPDGGAPLTLWDNATHEEMRTAITTDADPATVGAIAEQWVGLGNELTLHQESLAGAITDSLANWAGPAGDAARTGLAELGRWLGTTAQAATLTGRQQEIHSQALNETQKLMAANPPVPFSATDAAAHLATITDPVAYAQQLTADATAAVNQQAARDQAARLMTQYDQTIAAAASTPYFATPPSLPEAAPRDALAPTHQNPPGDPAAARSGPASGEMGGEGGRAPSRGVPGQPTPASANAPDGRAVPGQTAPTADRHGTAPSRSSGGEPPNRNSTTGVRPGELTGGRPVSAGSTGAGGPLTGSRGGGRSGGAGRPDATGPRDSAARRPGGTGVPGEAADRPRGSVGGGARSAGVSESLGGPRSGGASPTAAGTSNNSAPPSNRGGGRKAEEEDDEEYRLADYLLGDLDLFDSDQVVAPPTIGA